MIKTLQLGFKFRIDYFGKGFSPCPVSKKLPPVELKIDKPIVTAMVHNQNDAVVVRSTIYLAHNLSCRVVAENVEDQATPQTLKHLDCDVGQGFYISRPFAGRGVDEAVT